MKSLKLLHYLSTSLLTSFKYLTGIKSLKSCILKEIAYAPLFYIETVKH